MEWKKNYLDIIPCILCGVSPRYMKRHEGIKFKLHWFDCAVDLSETKLDDKSTTIQKVCDFVYYKPVVYDKSTTS